MELIKSLHEVAGFVLALAGLTQILAKKEGVYHIIVGLTYLIAWLIVVVTGGMMGSALITLFGLLGFYMAVTGWRFAKRKRSTPRKPEKTIYWIGLGLATTTLGWGIILAIQGQSMGIVAVVFGVIFFTTTLVDVLEYIYKKSIRRRENIRKQWVIEHLRRMYISYIAAMTAFTVINRPFDNDLINWLLPTAIGTALIYYSSRRQTKKIIAREMRQRKAL